jgi:hypothetical protein
MTWSNPNRLVRQCHGRLRVLRACVREGGGGVAFGVQCCQARAREFLRLQMGFCTGNGSLGGIEIRRCRRGRARRSGGGDGLPSVAHFLHGRASASDEAGNTDKNSEKAQHRVHGH